ncbi:MAG: ATP synthase F1 subunit gamma [Candidatus Pacebacteria bacterium CG_4_9_14_3_um_filter_40_12]|nr:MAG: ATP synthase F1 subunit gamma [Candidatus Pacebacteria bacterium CG10_big_fil_rev_8_21_14_0_10_40_26]PIZ78510.1 MAG: ATP synthase F1 subunit gamma [Candidatus Pacebacteria bacterium CG_4_10_14_0_2_um_filter_40_20]PJA69361.1 MAG: ATP synthase F1 subunit gamma [Candidatus Pacebacteria bacterium CG_4_9_14_3_um_filter_40_12]PJC41378.1 MAG: ATP synthase F1 subunit gamma [Candidatus Pacebacteria bacterium CG_4_9_14_0_2_um_filter_40_15]
MPNTRQIVQRIKTAGNISKITKAMEMVSASKMRRAQAAALATRPYTNALNASLQSLAAASSTTVHPLLTEHDTGVDIAVIISTDKGLCGSLNQTLFKETISWLKSHPNGKVVAVGKKSVGFARISGIELYAQFIELPDQVSSSDTIAISTLIREGFLDQEFRSVSLIYMDFVSTLVQKVCVQQVLPLPKIQAENEALVDKLNEAEYIFEPSAHAILNNLLPYYLENSVYQAFLEARASEHSARMVSMKNASENAGELMSDLRLVYNKSRQASITSELLDVVTALLAQDS